MTSIRSKILAGCALLTLLTWLLGAYGQKTQRELGVLALRIYDEAFMGVSYLRSAQVGFATIAEAMRQGRIDPDAANAVLEDLAVAKERAMSPEGRDAADRLAQSVQALDPSADQRDDDAYRALQSEFERAVETFAGDGFRYRRNVGGLIAQQASQTSVVIGVTILGALLITLGLTRLIAPPVRRAVRIAQAIAAGKLDNVIEAKGHGETALLLRALGLMQGSIAAALARIHALMDAQAANHAGELAEQHARLEAALDNMTQGLCLFGDDGRLVVANRRFGHMFGAPTPNATAETVLREAGLDLLLEESAGHATVAALSCELADGRVIAVSRQNVAGGGWVVTYEDISERRSTEARLAHVARHDVLTGLPNRLLFSERVQAGLARARRGDRIALLCLDLDRFQTVNDTLGHGAGDLLLQAVAERLRLCTREIDLVVRLGGDEFVVVQEMANVLSETTALAQRLIEVLCEPFDLLGQDVLIGVRVGVALSIERVDTGKSAEPQETANDLLKRAELALGRAKQEGRSAFCFYEPAMDEAVQRRHGLERDLHRALAKDQLEVVYQPLVQSAGIAGFEALLRWNHPDLGQVSPANFIPVAEETGLIGAIGAWVLARACADAARWPGALKVAVNLSPVQFQSRSLVADTTAALTASGLPAKRLELEITESMLIQDGAAVLETLHALRAMGVRIAMDDFGTGYSSLSYLHRFPFDKIKIDQSFVNGLLDKEECRTIVRAVIGIGRSLGIAVNAEGVETEAQLLALRTEGCGEIQGYYFSRPRPSREIGALLIRLGNATLGAASPPQLIAAAPESVPVAVG